MIEACNVKMARYVMPTVGEGKQPSVKGAWGNLVFSETPP